MLQHLHHDYELNNARLVTFDYGNWWSTFNEWKWFCNNEGDLRSECRRRLSASASVSGVRCVIHLDGSFVEVVRAWRMRAPQPLNEKVSEVAEGEKMDTPMPPSSTCRDSLTDLVPLYVFCGQF